MSVKTLFKAIAPKDFVLVCLAHWLTLFLQNYQNEESEAWIGEWMEKRGVRDQMIVATKVSFHP